MNNKYIITSAIAFAFVSAGIFLYSARLHLEADSLIGIAAVLAVAGVAAIEYRLHGRRQLSE